MVDAFIAGGAIDDQVVEGKWRCRFDYDFGLEHMGTCQSQRGALYLDYRPPPLPDGTCADIGFTANSDDVATNVRIEGGTCDQASALIRQVADQHDFYSGPPTFEAAGYSCSVELEDDVLPVGHYRCAGSGGTVMWDKT